MDNEKYYEISSEALQHHVNYSINRYKPFFHLLQSTLSKDAKDSPYISELSDIVVKYSSSLAGIVEGIRAIFKQNTLLEHLTRKMAFLIHMHCT